MNWSRIIVRAAVRGVRKGNRWAAAPYRREKKKGRRR